LRSLKYRPDRRTDWARPPWRIAAERSSVGCDAFVHAKSLARRELLLTVT
jgi:hypothetical protein